MNQVTMETAKAYLSAGLSVLPAVRQRKRPSVGTWKTWAERLPTECEVGAWFSNEQDGVCIVAGEVSGNLECIDFDAHGECFEAWAGKIDQALFDRLAVERTPSGGYHVLYRTEVPVGGNAKLAQGMRDGKKTTLIETRGEGGLFLCAPTGGYWLLQGSFTELSRLSQDERKALVSAAEAMDECVAETAPAEAAQGQNSAFLVKPGDDWCARGDIRPVLTARGWKSLGTKADGNELWQRPGKSGDGNSATFNGEILCVFSTNAAPFEAKGYNKFQVYALLEHGGDFTAAAKDLLERGYGKGDDVPVAECAGIMGLAREVARSGVAQKGSEQGGNIPADEEDTHETAFEYEDPGTLPEELFDVPGFIAELMGYTLRTAYYPNKALAFAGAMAMLAHLTGRRFKDRRGSRFNLYLLALAKSGTGKEHPRAVNIDLATQMAMVGELGDTFASGEGLEDSLCMSPTMLYQVDEVDYLFNTVKLKDARAEQINSMLLKLYSESKTTHIMRKKAIQRGQPSIGSSIIQPHLTVFGTATPKFFYQSLTERTMENGLLARCIVLEAGERGAAGTPHEEDFPKGVLETVRDLVRLGHEQNLTDQYPHPAVLAETTQATKRLVDVFGLADGEYRKATDAGNDSANALWARAGEKVAKLAALYAISKNRLEPLMDVDAVEWAWRFVDHMTRRMLYMASMFVTNSEFEAQSMSIVRKIREKSGRISHGMLLRNSHLDKDAFKRAIDTLAESGMVKKEFGQRGGVFYALCI
jgi:hypothetical protein